MQNENSTVYELVLYSVCLVCRKKTRGFFNVYRVLSGPVCSAGSDVCPQDDWIRVFLICICV